MTRIPRMNAQLPDGLYWVFLQAFGGKSRYVLKNKPPAFGTEERVLAQRTPIEVGIWEKHKRLSELAAYAARHALMEAGFVEKGAEK